MPSRLPLSLKAMRAFVRVVDAGSITAAAQQLNTAASAVATAVDQVEAELGADLLIRTRARGIAPTAEGRDMAARFRLLLEEYASVLDQGRAMTQTLTGSLRIGYYAPVAPAFLPAILCPMIRANPGLQLAFHEHDNDSAQQALISGQLDVILFAGQDLRPGIETQVLLDLPPYVLARAGHPVLRQNPVLLSEVAQHPIVQLDRPLARPYLDQLFGAKCLTPDIVARADSTEMVRSLVGAGAGIAILSMRPRTDVSYGGDRLGTCPLEGGLPNLQLMSGQIAGRPRKPVSAFLEALTAWMQSPAADALTEAPFNHA